MAKAKKVSRGKPKKGGKAARRKPAASSSRGLRPIVIPGAWPFPMGSKT